MGANGPDGGSPDTAGFDAIWSSDGVTRSLAPSSTGIPADLPYLFAAGQRFGPYVIVRPLGKGGMGQVYEAEERESGRRVAIKILGRGIGDEEERQRFLREGQLAASLSHPNCVYVFGTSEVQGFPVIAMELAPGGTLKDVQPQDGRMAVSAAADAILQLIAGLDAAAALGILHRDIKPSNAFVDRDGRVMIGDFGLSIAAAARDQGGRGMISGTPGFASPEQMRGEPLDVRSDIYAVGATLFYLLAGRPPVEHTSVTTTVNGGAAPAAPAIGTVRPDVPRRLSSVIAKCLAVAPASRYASYAALAAALEPFRSAVLTPAPIGRRLLAGVIDSYVASLPLMPLGMLAGASLLREQHNLLVMMAPSLICSLLYYGIFEGHFGCAAGKALLNLRVVNRARLSPGFWRALARAFVFLAPQQAVSQATAYVMIRRLGGATSRPGDMTEAVAGVLAAGISLMVIALLFSTMRRRNGMAAVHDLASRTNVVLRPRAIEAREARARREIADERTYEDAAAIGPYTVAPSVKAAAAGVSAPVVVEAWDARLRRAVWLELMPGGEPPMPAARRDLSRPARVRWLSGRRTNTECWDAFEAIPGEPFLGAIATPQPWARVRHWLHDLAIELSAGVTDGSLPPLALDRLWIGADDRARLLDWPAPGAGDTATPIVADPQQFLHDVAARALGSAAVPLPLPGRQLLDRLKAGTLADPAALEASATSVLRGPAVIPRRTRMLQMGAYATIPALIAIALCSVLLLQGRSRTTDPSDYALDVTLKRLDALEKKGDRLSADESKQRDLIQTYIGERLREEAEARANLARAFPGVANIQRDAAMARRALARPRETSAERLAEADVMAAGLVEKDTESRLELSRPLPLWRLLALVTGGAAAFIAAIGLLGALVFRSGFTFRAMGAALVTRDGRPASRVRALVRALFAWSPLALYFVLVRVSPSKAPATVLNASGYTLVLVLLVLGAIYAVMRPSRALQDRLAGTWIVPR